ncbi:hypothetical protein LCGC14_0567900 [marine sediment metagenome]|uniref:Uncharacterized protein n=1 Tax=marine sediment metagenome TaxID=412755 RepID=A0A0F9RJZ6_9ZZZZ
MIGQDRELERGWIRDATADAARVAKTGNAGPAITDALFYEQLILAVLNLAETVDALAGSIGAHLSRADPEGD